jgi:hypothetical protein
MEQAKEHDPRHPIVGGAGDADPPERVDLAEAAWYADPTNPQVMRYWDGATWTGQEMPSATALASGGESSSPAPATIVETGASHMNPALPVHRGTHYLLGFGTEHDGVYGPGLAEVGATLVTGEVPPGYDRVTFDCEDGEAVNATFLDPASVDSANLFVALVDHRVTRMVATKDGGRYGIFFDVGLLEESGNSALSE